MENECHYLSSRGLLKSCDHHTRQIVSGLAELDADLLKSVKEGDSVYITLEALRQFCDTFLPTLQTRIVLVTGDSDKYISDKPYLGNYYSEYNITWYQPILESPFIVKWFVTNCMLEHPKIVHLPYGLDYHTLAEQDIYPWGKKASPIQQETELLEIVNSATHFKNRRKPIYSNFHFNYQRGDRREAMDGIPSELIYYEPGQLTRNASFRNQSEFIFIASPWGNGPDCIRTWEGLILGCIPIVKRSPMCAVFDDLPVLIVDKWSDITEQLLLETIQRFSTMTFMYEKLTLEYWIKRIKDAGRI
jgi:hypothetical protein